LIRNQLITPDIWQVALSKNKNKKETWERLLKEKKLGALDLLRNLRNMKDVGISIFLIKEALEKMKVEKVLPFRFITAAKYYPQLEPELEQAMFRCLDKTLKLTGTTILLIDVSQSMEEKISEKSELMKSDAAYALGMLLREICEQVFIYSFSYTLVEIAPRRGFALRDLIINSQLHGGTELGSAVQKILQIQKADRLIVITDEQTQDRVPKPNSAIKTGYMINVSTDQNGVGYGSWLHIDGFSEAVINYIYEYEKQQKEFKGDL
jgi:hypothetical protein